MDNAVAIQAKRTEKQGQARESFKNGLILLAKAAESGYAKVVGAPEAIKSNLLHLQDTADSLVTEAKIRVNGINEASAQRLDARIGKTLGAVQGRVEGVKARYQESKAVKPNLLEKFSQKKQAFLEAAITKLQTMLAAEKGNAEKHAGARDEAQTKATELRTKASEHKANSSWFGTFRKGLQSRLS